MLRLVFHLVVAVHHLSCSLFYGCIVDFSGVTDVQILHMSTVQKSYLTGWNFAVQTTFCVVSLVEDVIRLKLIRQPRLVKLSHQKTIRTTKDIVFTSVVFPVTCFVSFIFWTIYNYDRELVYPASIDQVLPPWYNHSLHSSILLVVFLEMSLVFHPYPRRKWGILVITAFFACYLACLLLTQVWYGIWVYPLFAIMTWTQRIGMFSVCLVFSWLCHELGQRLNSVIWSNKMSKTVNGRTIKKLS